ncbi:MAG TPA: hypothetical protein VGC42_14245 [Kofleriaceae bacterium]
MRLSRSGLALVAMLALLSGCFGYNRSAKRWAYVADSILLAGGAATIAIDVTQKDTPCMPDASGNGCTYQSSLHGTLVIGAVLAAAGLFGILFNATRDDVKSSR